MKLLRNLKSGIIVKNLKKSIINQFNNSSIFFPQKSQISVILFKIELEEQNLKK